MFNRVYHRLHKIFFLKYQNLQRQLVLNIYVWTIGHPVLHFRSQFPFSLLTRLAHRITMYIYDMIALHSQPSHSLIRRNVKKTQCLRKLAFSINIFNFAFHLIKSNFKAITAWWVHLCSRKNSVIKNPFEVNVVNVSAHLTICLANGEAMRWRLYLWDKFQFKLNSHNFETARSAEVSFFRLPAAFVSSHIFTSTFGSFRLHKQ